MIINDEIEFFNNFKNNVKEFIDSHKGYKKLDIADMLNTNIASIDAILNMTYKQSFWSCIKIYFSLNKIITFSNCGDFSYYGGNINEYYKNMMKILRDKINQEMKNKNLTDKNMADKLGVQTASIKYFKDEKYYTDPRATTVLKILNYFNLKLYINDCKDELNMLNYLEVLAI